VAGPQSYGQTRLIRQPDACDDCSSALTSAHHRPGPGEHLLVYDGRGGRQTSGYEGSVDVNRRDSMRAAGEAAHRKTLTEHRPHLAEWCRTTRDPFTVPG
jgi:hypothetical protein